MQRFRRPPSFDNKVTISMFRSFVLSIASRTIAEAVINLVKQPIRDRAFGFILAPEAAQCSPHACDQWRADRLTLITIPGTLKSVRTLPISCTSNACFMMFVPNPMTSHPIFGSTHEYVCTRHSSIRAVYRVRHEYRKSFLIHFGSNNYELSYFTAFGEKYTMLPRIVKTR